MLTLKSTCGSSLHQYERGKFGGRGAIVDLTQHIYVCGAFPRASFDACPVEYTVGRFVILLWSLWRLLMSSYQFGRVLVWSLAVSTNGRLIGMLSVVPLSFYFSAGCLWWSWGHKYRKRIFIDYLYSTCAKISLSGCWRWSRLLFLLSCRLRLF